LSALVILAADYEAANMLNTAAEPLSGGAGVGRMYNSKANKNDFSIYKISKYSTDNWLRPGVNA